MPEWISSIAAVGALIAAIMAARFAGKLFQVEAGRDERFERSRRSSQASRVSAWIEAAEHPSHSGEWRIVLVLLNASELPVYGLFTIEGVPRSGEEGRRVGVGMRVEAFR